VRQFLALCAVFPAVLGLSCPFELQPNTGEEGPFVNLQVTEYKDIDGFERIVSELERRGLQATILTKAPFVTEHCDRFRELAQEGYEIMAFARPEERDGESMTLSQLSYEEQDALIRETKAAIEACIQRKIYGFRCTRFDQNEDTYEIVQDLDFTYNLGFVAQTESCMPGHEHDTLPCPAPGYDFWMVPMHSAYFDGNWVAFCDNPFRRLTDAASWGELMKSELDSMHTEKRPLLVEVHPYYSGVDDAAFAAFVGFLDHAQERSAQFISIAELVGLFGQSAAQGDQQNGSSGNSGCSCD